MVSLDKLMERGNIYMEELTKIVSDFNGIPTHNHIVCKRTLKHKNTRTRKSSLISQRWEKG